MQLQELCGLNLDKDMENVWEHEVIIPTPVTSFIVRSVVFYAYEEQSIIITVVSL